MTTTPQTEAKRMTSSQKTPKRIDALEIKAKCIVAGLGLAAEDELTMLRRLEELLLEGIVMGYDLLAGRCEAAETIISKLTMDHHTSPNYLAGVDMAQQHFATFPCTPIRDPAKSDLVEEGPICPSVKVTIKDGCVTQSSMYPLALPDGTHLLFPVLVNAKAVPLHFMRGQP